MYQRVQISKGHWHGPSVSAQYHRVSQTLNQADKLAPKGRLLLVDDEPAVRDALQRVLEVEGFDVVAVSNCQDALVRLAEWDANLVLLDVNVAAENGWDLCRHALAKNPNLNVIVITARPDQAAAALEFGADALMEKPLNLPQLLKIIDGLLTKKSVRNRLPRRKSSPISEAKSVEVASLAIK